MINSNYTLAIYGIRDINNSNYPNLVHDHNITLFKDGEIVKYLHLERYTRNKHDNKLHENIYSLLQSEKLLAYNNLDIVFVDNVIGRSFISEKGDMRFEAPLNNEVLSTFEKGKSFWLGKNINSFVLNHELAHIYSCLPFYGNFKNNSLLVHFDGGASLSNFSAWHYIDSKLLKLEANWSLKYLSSLFNANAMCFSIIGAKRKDQNSVPGKLMGFASYGTYNYDIERWLVENNFFSDIWKKKTTFFNKLKHDWDININSFDQKNTFIQDIAATIQYIFQRDFLEKLKFLQDNTKSKYLYLTGGSALNIVSNTNIVNSNVFEDVFIPPCTNDSGLSIGAGACVEFAKHKSVSITNAYINNWGINEYKNELDLKEIRRIAKLIADKKVVGVCNGYGESGPRALGNRSIIALASSIDISKKVSQYHKKREWYRPVAPIMLEKNAKYFTGLTKIHHLSKYMLIDFDILPGKKQEIEGVVHVDGTSRIQTLFSRNDNSFIYDLLQVLDNEFGVKALINTSFNIKGEPIVHTVDDAINSAKNMKLDAVVLNGKLRLI
ncbi:MAG: carbamoyltransferase C-terminal domain-containing protein [Bacteroidota bacterium]|nr:carbamoyltransferase C-terminal domain-containing protein [Bacteroidota bacterium]